MWRGGVKDVICAVWSSLVQNSMREDENKSGRGGRAHVQNKRPFDRRPLPCCRLAQPSRNCPWVYKLVVMDYNVVRIRKTFTRHGIMAKILFRHHSGWNSDALGLLRWKYCAGPEGIKCISHTNRLVISIQRPECCCVCEIGRYSLAWEVVLGRL